ncbi:hypothetical protein [Flavobacterium denitrificans]|uniref:hypothetical protein n=1 Tax=Flavobacterium denitrificans TaxID=281361 RepID=UPI0003F5345A|nr:hypothetical protein [Flavobacterium denitrificans]
MSNGLKLTIPYAVTDTSIPKLYNDPIMSEGSLFLLDFPRQNPTLVNNLPITNFASSVSDSLLSGTSGSNVSNLAFGGGVSSDTGKLIEKTGKGAIHCIVSQVNDVSGISSMSAPWPEKIMNYIVANNSHQFYCSIWSNMTRTALINTGSHSYLMQNTSNYYYINEFSTSLPNVLIPSGHSLGRLITPPFTTSAAPTVRFQNNGFSGYTGSLPSSLVNRLLTVGREGVYDTFLNHKSPSMIIYRVYLEDLTVSGRDYATVSALDKALFDEAFGVGGKFNGDTFTNPSTLL